ncbi:hypothetical protein AB0H83_22070 [Dactylosporangium sp. NPDC050688]|uniref:LysM peptidoglycan-binding domain-containing protein n=1 Tax=Dactylosporangium sp. NPDC050688 TaxID=3157217 RepID=UPI0033F37EDA
MAPWLLFVAILAGTGHVGAVPAFAEGPSPSTSVGQANPVKYYVVGTTGTSERQYLFQIAARTLGDGRRYLEIFELNKDRLQPDGQRLEDPLVLMPGWILILPADADGPGVVVGTPPIFGSAQAPPPTTGSGAATQSSSGNGVRAAAFILVTTILGLALHLLRRGRRIRLPVPAQAARDSGLERVSAVRRIRRRWARTPQDGGRLESGAVEDGGLIEPSRPIEPSARPTPPAPAPEPEPKPEPEPEPKPEPTISADPVMTRVEASLRVGADLVTVRLIGARPDADADFLGRGLVGPRHSGGAVVRLGEPGPDALWVDLAVSPDVVRITGVRAGVLRQAAEIARQLSQAGVSTVVVDDVPGLNDLTSRRVASLRELADGPGSAQLLVVFLDELAPADVVILHELIARRRPRVVPVAVGSGPRSRWSIAVS